MANDKALRLQLVNMLTGSDAHAGFDAAVKNIPVNLRGTRPHGAEHSPWEVLEHLRITQWDILEFSRKPNHQSPEFPRGYWPGTQAPPNEKAWDQSVQAFREDLEALCELIANESTDLLSIAPSGDTQTVLREALLVADHTAYHLGELVLLRRLLGAWQ
jgi:hypothetical protein